MSGLPWIPFLIATALAVHGYRRKSLSPSGSVAAFVVGFLMLAVRLRVFGISLLVFYLVGSRATKVGKQKKAKLEDGHQEAGYRTAWQVFCNSFSAFLASLAWASLYDKDFIVPLNNYSPLKFEGTYVPDAECPITGGDGSLWSRRLLYLSLGHFACCLGDTLASELGILSKTPPILITTLRRVPPGTNGGLSLVGTLASIGGGVIMGLNMFLSLAVQSTRCRSEWMSLFVQLMLWGAFGGLFGSLLDSIMGATLQKTRYSAKKKKILQDDSIPQVSDDIKIISGMNILTNNQVNLLSSIVTALLLAYVAS